jgi:hypothetical protein
MTSQVGLRFQQMMMIAQHFGSSVGHFLSTLFKQRNTILLKLPFARPVPSLLKQHVVLWHPVLLPSCFASCAIFVQALGAGVGNGIAQLGILEKSLNQMTPDIQTMYI